MRRRRPTNAYQEFIRDEMKRLKVSHPGMDHQAAFKMAASSKSRADTTALLRLLQLAVQLCRHWRFLELSPVP